MKIQINSDCGFKFLHGANFPIVVRASNGNDLVNGTIKVHQEEFIRLGLHPACDVQKPYLLFSLDDDIGILYDL